jgi:hypothetical protein
MTKYCYEISSFKRIYTSIGAKKYKILENTLFVRDILLRQSRECILADARKKFLLVTIGRPPPTGLESFTVLSLSKLFRL